MLILALAISVHHLASMSLDQELCAAASDGRLDAVEQLIEKGADINATDQYGCTPLHWAAYTGFTEIVALLLGKGANINVTDQNGWTPLAYAAYKDHDKIVALLTPLHNSVRKDNTEMIVFLLSKGTDINATDQHGWTPLHYAVLHGSLKIVTMLLQCGANPILSTNKDKTASSIAQNSHPNYLALTNTLKRYTALEENFKFYSDPTKAVDLIFANTNSEQKVAQGDQILVFDILCSTGDFKNLTKLRTIIFKNLDLGCTLTCAKQLTKPSEEEYRNYVFNKIIGQTWLLPRYIDHGWYSKSMILEKHGRNTPFSTTSQFKDLMICVDKAEIRRLWRKTSTNNMFFYWQ